MMRYRHFFFNILFLVGIGIIFFMPSFAFAQDTLGLQPIEDTIALGSTDIRIIIAKIIRVVLGLLGTIVLGLMVYAGAIWMTSAGNEDKITQAKKILSNAVIGLVIILSSLAIVQFIIGSLSDALLLQVGDGDSPDDGCVGIWCEIEPGDPEDRCLVENNLFVVKSITPNTTDTEGTGMTNTVVRVLFNHALASNVDIDSIATISGEEVIQAKEIILDEGRQLVSFIFENNTDICNADDDVSCLANGTYLVDVNEELRDEFNQTLDIEETVCGTFETEAAFTNNIDALDIVVPAVDAIEINGKTEEQAGVDGIILRQGQSYNIKTRATDRSDAQGGMSFLTTRITRDGNPDDTILLYDAPRVDVEVAKNPLDIFYQLPLGTGIPVPARYIVEVTASDIDSNNVIEESHFILVGEHCENGVQDEDETGVDMGGSCLDMGACVEDWQCVSHSCVNNQCVTMPIITGMSPESWDGAAGNMVTIEGLFFGEEEGLVFFEVVDGAGNVESSDRAFPPEECSGDDLWKDGWIVVSVPNSLPENSTSRIRVVKAGGDADFQDTSIDAHGPKPGPRLGLFLENGIDRPGICVVKEIVDNNIGNAVITALPDAQISVQGKGFGAANTGGTIWFGEGERVSSFWNSTQVQTIVPRRFGSIGISIKVGDEVSNVYPFTIMNPDDRDSIPVILDISPSSTTRESLVTLTGDNFGEFVGTVYLAPSLEEGASCTPETCIMAIVDMTESCGGVDTWGNNQVIIQIPYDDIELGTYYPVLVNSVGLRSQVEESLEIIDGPPRPGLCSISPSAGPAPLAEGADPLSISGVNVLDDTVVYFWTNGAQPSDDIDILNNTWLSSQNHRQPNGEEIISSTVSENGREIIKTYLPVNNAGTSLMRGSNPIRVAGEDGILSNPVQYTVSDCRDGVDTPGEDYHCCKTGEEAGQWKDSGFICAGEERSAGYVWRFSSGIIPNFPRVLEQCDSGEWRDPNARIDMPSPAPWGIRPDGDSACLNANVVAKFSMGMDESTLNRDTVKMYRCDEDLVGRMNCSNKQEVLDTIVSYINQTLYIWEPRNGQLLEQNMWYQVELADTIQSLEQVPVFGIIEEQRRPLLKTRTCGDGTAYCFEFKTGNGSCELQAAGIEPPEHTAIYLGRLQDPRYSFDTTHVFNPANPYYYHVWGRGEKICQPLSADGLGWEWTSDKEEDARVFVQPGFIGEKEYTDSRAVVDALVHTAPESVILDATTPVGGLTSSITALSTLTINIGDPKIIEAWPKDCTESCTNASVGMRFNRKMMEGTYAGNVHIYKCAGEECLEEGLEEIAFNELSSDPLIYRVTPAEVLDEDTWYFVKATEGILSVGRYNTDGTVAAAGKALIPDEWRFRTKSEDGYCMVETVRMDPASFTSRNIGEKTKYISIPYSARNECSSVGQELNPWEYGWEWNVLDPLVASVTNFRSSVNTKSYCSSLSCLPNGSDIRKNEYEIVPSLCGDGIVGFGEDCDISSGDEIIGQSCTFNCLRPGNTADTCGNREVETHLGEECDGGEFCSDTCTNVGSSQQFSGDENLPWCGGGEVTSGEDCDLSEGCSDRCLHVGTQLSQKWCSDNIYNENIEGVKQACVSAISVCGNDILEDGEECEIIGGQLFVAGQSESVASNQVERYCSNSCLVSNLCELESVETVDNGGLRCDSLSPGCLPDQCRLLGSSVHYNQSSLCGDGVVGIGEYASCEIDDGENTRSALGENPVQVVTAIGANIDPNTSTQRTKIQSFAKRLAFPGENGIEINSIVGDISGDGDYALTCGYYEWRKDENLILDGGMELVGATYWRGWGPNVDWTKTTQKAHTGQRSMEMGRDAEIGGAFLQTGLPLEAGETYTLSFWYFIESGTLFNIIGIPSANADFEDSGLELGETNGEWREYTRTFTAPDPIPSRSLIRFSTRDGISYIDDVRIEIARESIISTKNDCPNNDNNADGVGTNSCCYKRPVHTSVYPEDKATGVCPNTYISFDFNEQIDSRSIENSVLLAKGFEDINHQCDTEDITNIVTGHLASAAEPIGFFKRMWNTVKQWFSSLFSPSAHAALADVKVWCQVDQMSAEVIDEINPDTEVTTSKVNIILEDVLEGQTTYAAIVQGGLDGVKNVLGVSISGVEKDGLFPSNDIITFTTAQNICKIESVSVSPSSHLFSVPQESKEFEGFIYSTQDQYIQSTPAYAWEWTWGPTSNALFEIPVLPATTNTYHTVIGARDIEGDLYAAVNVKVTADITDEHTGKVFSGMTHLIADFCESPWPERGVYPYEDDVYNFSMGYCSDEGLPGIRTDDLPYLRSVITGDIRENYKYGDITGDERVNGDDLACYGHAWLVNGRPDCMDVSMRKADLNCDGSLNEEDASLFMENIFNNWGDYEVFTPNCKPEMSDQFNAAMTEDLLYRVLFFNDINDDVIGLQIFQNSDRDSAVEWFEVKFTLPGSLDDMNGVNIGGYDAITDGNNYYINVVNESDGTVYNNILLMSVNPGAQASTRNVFEQLVQSFDFNINLSDFGRCLASDVDEDVLHSSRRVPHGDNAARIADANLSCTTDFDCRDSGGFPFPKEDTNGVCSNVKTKFLRDLDRIDRAKVIVDNLEDYVGDPIYPELKSGTYIPKYVNSRWPSWGNVFGAAISTVRGTAPKDPIDQWTSCGTCSNPADGIAQSCVSNEGCEGDDNICVIADAQTCWDPGKAQFICPVVASIFEYQYSEDDYTLHVPLEYFDTEDDIVIDTFGDENGIINHVTRNRQCNPTQVIGLYGDTCGDGIKNVETEECDDGNSSNLDGCNDVCLKENLACKNRAPFNIQGDNTVINFYVGNRNSPERIDECRENTNQEEICRAYGLTCFDLDRNCTFDLETASDASSVLCRGLYNGEQPEIIVSCGNGILERDKGEVCDDGALNGTYGYCAGENSEVAECRGRHDQYCGNKEKDGNVHDSPLELCDISVRKVPVNMQFAEEQPVWLPYHINKTQSCSYDCQDYGEYCGDGDVQYDQGEQCDDGNSSNLDGCNDVCLKENLACKNRAPFNIQGYNTVINFYVGDRNSPERIDECRENTNQEEICRAYGLTCFDLDRNCTFDLETASDASSVLCRGVYSGEPQEIITTDAGTCGDGEIQSPNNNNVEEECDLGADNGIICDPEYGQSCTYCAADCRILTRERTAWCGNGIIDKLGTEIDENNAVVTIYESCDSRNGIIVKQPNEDIESEMSITTSTQSDGLAVIDAYCPDRGEYTCSADCTQVRNGCVDCGVLVNNPRSAVPKLSVLNVLETEPLGETCHVIWIDHETTESVNCIGDSTPWSLDIKKRLYRLYDDNSEPKELGFSRWINFITPDINWDVRYMTSVDYSDYTGPQWLITEENGRPQDASIRREKYNFDFDKDEWENDSPQHGLVTDLLCSDQYGVFFDGERISTEKQFSMFEKDLDDNYLLETYGSFFPYPVNSQPGVVINELIISPAVPENVYRVVVSYQKDRMPEGIEIMGNLYSESKFYEDSVVDLFGDDGTNILNELKVMLYDQNLRNSYLCDSLMSGVDDYWLPAYSELNKECLWLHTGQKYEHTVLNTPESERIYIHKKGELDNTVVKTMTIGLASQLTTSTFFVSAITPDNRSISIEQLRDKGLKVSIYTYHQDQIPELSLYTSDPNNEFEFTTGETGISFNAGARYWQVFNIEEGPDHSIAPIQSIETDIVDIRCNISEDFENCSR